MVSVSRLTGPCSLALFAVSLLALPLAITGLDIISMLPSSILDMLPLPCLEGESAEFPMAVNCAVANLAQCSGLLTALPTFEEIPSAVENATECVDIQEPFCDIAGTCPPCLDEFDVLIRCIVLNSPEIADFNITESNITDLVDSCALTCDEDLRM